MANQDQKYPDWFLWMWGKGFLFFCVVVLVFMCVLAGAAYYLDQRMVDIAERLDYQPPSSYQPPDLEMYAPGGTSPDAMTIRKSVYIPVYSHVYHQGGAPYLLETMLSIRNTDTARPIFLESVRYYDTEGELAKTHVDRMIKLKPLQTIEFVVKQRDATGGSGANFLVVWMAEQPVERPIVEAVMVGSEGAQAICFSRSGQELSSSPQESKNAETER